MRQQHALVVAQLFSIKKIEIQYRLPHANNRLATVRSSVGRGKTRVFVSTDEESLDILRPTKEWLRLGLYDKY